jgi:hypothetical protein
MMGPEVSGKIFLLSCSSKMSIRAEWARKRLCMVVHVLAIIGQLYSVSLETREVS